MALFKNSSSSLLPTIELISTDSTYLFALNYVILFFLIESNASSIAYSAFLFPPSSQIVSSAVSFKKFSKLEVSYCFADLLFLFTFFIFT